MAAAAACVAASRVFQEYNCACHHESAVEGGCSSSEARYRSVGRSDRRIRSSDRRDDCGLWLRREDRIYSMGRREVAFSRGQKNQKKEEEKETILLVNVSTSAAVVSFLNA